MQTTTPPPPPWAWSLAAWITGLLTAALLAAAVTVAWEGDRAEFEEHRALFFAGALAEVAAVEDAPRTHAFIQHLSVAQPDLVAAWTLLDGGEDEFGISRSQTYKATLEPGLDGKRLADLPRAPLHKRRADRFARATGGLDDEVRPGRVHPSLILEHDDAPAGQAAALPLPQATPQGVAGVTVAPSLPPAPVPWLLLLALVLAAGLGATFANKALAPRGPKALAASLLTTLLLTTGGGALATTLLYRADLAQHLTARGADVQSTRDAAAQVGLHPERLHALLNRADRHVTGAAGYLAPPDALAATPDPGPLAASRLAAGRSSIIWIAGLILMAILMLLHKKMAEISLELRDKPHAYLYVAPSLLGMLVLVFIPFAFGVGLSAFDNDARRYYFVGLDNFIEIFTGSRAGDVSFYWTLFVTVLWTALNITLHVGVGLGLALILKRPTLRFKRLYRVLLIIPWAVPNYITALIWKGMFNKEFGAVNLFIEKTQLLLGFEPSRIDWLGGGFLTAFTANLVTNTWLGFPFMMVVSLGALQSIPQELYEAAEVDGASRWQQLRLITLPLLKPALFPAIILGTIWTFNMFNIIYLVSGGGPNNSTEILITDAYRAFDVLGRYGFAAAYSVVIFGILLLYTLITNRITQATEGALE